MNILRLIEWRAWMKKPVLSGMLIRSLGITPIASVSLLPTKRATMRCVEKPRASEQMPGTPPIASVSLRLTGRSMSRTPRLVPLVSLIACGRARMSATTRCTDGLCAIGVGRRDVSTAIAQSRSGMSGRTLITDTGVCLKTGCGSATDVITTTTLRTACERPNGVRGVGCGDLTRAAAI